MSRKNNPIPSDQDVADILEKLGASPDAALALPSAVSSTSADEDATPVNTGTDLDVTTGLKTEEPEAEQPGTTDGNAGDAPDDDRPIVINLPGQTDPTLTILGAMEIDGKTKAIPLVEPVVLGRVVANTPAFDSNGEPISPVPTSTAGMTGSIPVARDALDVIHEMTPIADPGPEFQPSAEEQAVLVAHGVTGWWDEQDKYWSIRQGPRRGGIPAGASLDEWKTRCASISVTGPAS